MIRWELVVMVRKAFLVTAFTLWSDVLTIKLMLIILCLVIAIYFQKGYSPMKHPSLDRLESVTLTFNALVLTITQGIVSSRANGVAGLSETMIYAIFYSFIGGCVAIIAWIGVVIYHQRDVVDYDTERKTMLLQRLDGEYATLK